MLWLALLRVKAAPPQHAPHHANNFKPCPKEGAEAAVLHHCPSNPSSRPVHDLLGSMMENGVLRLFVVTPLVATPNILFAVALLVIVVVDRDVTHLCVLGGSIALIDGSGGRNGRGSGQSHLPVM